jgi:hypothetical protein
MAGGSIMLPGPGIGTATTCVVIRNNPPESRVSIDQAAERRGEGKQFGEGVGLGVGNEKMRKSLQYHRPSAEPPKADIAGR